MTFQKDYILIILLGGILFVPFLGGAHLFDWDEINFAECAREMLETGNYLQVQIDYQPFWEKPPLFFWMQAAAMKVFGINEFAARIPNAICGIVTLLFIFFIGKKIHDRAFGWLWVLAYSGSILPHLYFRSGIIDPWFNLFIFSSLCLFILSLSSRENFGTVKKINDNSNANFDGLTSSKTVNQLTAGALLGSAVLTKGPVAFLIIGLTFGVYWISKKFTMFCSIPQLLWYGFSAIAVTSLWFGAEILTNGTWFVKEFITYQIRLFSTPDAGHGGFFGFHFVVLLLGCFPASVFALPSFLKKTTSPLLQQNFRKWMLILFWVVLILFSIARSKIVHYSSLCYFPLTYLAALYLRSIFLREKKMDKGIVFGLLGIGLLISVIFLALPFLGNNIELLYPLFENDPFAMGNLEAEVEWSYWGLIPAIVLLGGLVGFWGFARQKPPDPLKGERVLERRMRLVVDKVDSPFRGSGGFLLATTLFISLSLYFFINQIEAYSQNAAIEFYKNLEGKNVYVKNVGFKSYAPLFYTKKPKGHRAESRHLDWLLSDEVDKTVYFVTRIQDEKRFHDHPDVLEIGRKNGFVFFEKKKDQ